MNCEHFVLCIHDFMITYLCASVCMRVSVIHFSENVLERACT